MKRSASTFRRKWNHHVDVKSYIVDAKSTIDNNCLRSTYINKTFGPVKYARFQWEVVACPWRMNATIAKLNAHITGIRYCVHFMCLWVYGHGRIIFLLEYCNTPKAVVFGSKPRVRLQYPTSFQCYQTAFAILKRVCDFIDLLWPKISGIYNMDQLSHSKLWKKNTLLSACSF